MNMNK